MKITIMGGAGVRTPLIIEAMVRRQERIGLNQLALMDVDGEHLELIGALTAPVETSGRLRFTITRTTDPREALAGADFVITTFRAGGIESRVVDERVPLRLGVLGQETTGPGGFAMGMRSVPVLLGYLELMRELCPDAWLINFANPSGMLAEAAINAGGWRRTIGICDGPQTVGRAAAAALGLPVSSIYQEYFGLNHLGWTRAILHNGQDQLPRLIDMLPSLGSLPGLPFDAGFIATLGMIPNEYLYYFYHSQEAVQNILRGEQSRGEQIAGLNRRLFAELRRLYPTGDQEGMLDAYQDYLHARGESYMATETGHHEPAQGPAAAIAQAMEGEGYAGVALDLIEALQGARPVQMILNIPNAGSIAGMPADAVVEVPAYAGAGQVLPLAIGQVPAECLGLMLQVKAYERLTIAAATQGSYALAHQALTVHPLVRDYALGRAILDGYREEHGSLFPRLA